MPPVNSAVYWTILGRLPDQQVAHLLDGYAGTLPEGPARLLIHAAAQRLRRAGGAPDPVPPPPETN